MPWIDDLIEVLFGACEPPGVGRQQRWQGFADLLWQTVCTVLQERPNDRPEMRIVRGRAARPQILSQAAGDCLVYDESLDPWLLRLTELAVKKVPLAEAESSFLHLMAQRQYLQGNFAAAARDILALPVVTAAGVLRGHLAGATGHDSSPISAPNAVPDWAFSFSAAELVRVEREFIIAHELVHIFFRRFPDRFGDIANDYREMVIAPDRRRPLDLEKARQVAEVSMADTTWAVERKFGIRVSNAESAELRGGIDAATTKEDIDLIDRRLVEVSDDLDLLEECICDLVASLCLAVIRRDGSPSRLCGVVVGAEMALQNMRFIQIVDEYAGARTAGEILETTSVEDRISQSVHAAIARLSLYRDGWAVLSANFLTGRPRVPTLLHRALTKWNRLHTGYVLDPLFASFWPDYPGRFARYTADEDIERLVADGPRAVDALLRNQAVRFDESVDLTELSAVSTEIADLIRTSSTGDDTGTRQGLLR
ncbi:hypothetical protein [Dactylosporangium sp. CA-139066]|uniref:hypothetical protein n=1 Tax=Dactylosporangium sp. CA-139066 TaxID=3239930 RepID=UPI003D8AC514